MNKQKKNCTGGRPLEPTIIDVVITDVISTKSAFFVG